MKYFNLRKGDIMFIILCAYKIMSITQLTPFFVLEVSDSGDRANPQRGTPHT